MRGDAYDRAKEEEEEEEEKKEEEKEKEIDAPHGSAADAYTRARVHNDTRTHKYTHRQLASFFLSLRPSSLSLSLPPLCRAANSPNSCVAFLPH